jgi:hypothetical protein
MVLLVFVWLFRPRQRSLEPPSFKVTSFSAGIFEIRVLRATKLFVGGSHSVEAYTQSMKVRGMDFRTH